MISNQEPRVSIIAKNASGEEIAHFDMRRGSNLWVFLRKQQLPIGAACSGVGVCGACAVEITPAHTAATTSTAANTTTQNGLAEVVSPPTPFEHASLQKQGLNPDTQRLACLCRVYGDIVVKAPYW